MNGRTEVQQSLMLKLQRLWGFFAFYRLFLFIMSFLRRQSYAEKNIEPALGAGHSAGDAPGRRRGK
jgi:hypothetical protein